MQESPLTIDYVINSYKMLESENVEAKSQANEFLMNIVTSDEAWVLAKKMIVETQQLKYQFLGAQILYQKIVRQLHQFNTNSKHELKQFIFSQLNNEGLHFEPLIDKLASSGAYIGSVMSLNEWPTFLTDLIEFMKKSQNHLRNGLYVLERIPEELRITNKISFGVKNTIINELLKKEEDLSIVFNQVINLNNLNLMKVNMRAMESWAKSGFSMMKYTELVKKVFIVSVHSEDIFELAINVILQSIKAASLNKVESLSEIDPKQQLKSFSQNEIESVKMVIQYILEKKQTFLGSKVESEYQQIYLQIIKETVLNFGFLLLEDIAFHLIQIILMVTAGSDLRLSNFTFSFWIDFSEKVTKINLPKQVQQKVWNAFEQLFSVINKKVILENDYLLDDPDLKEDATIDDLTIMTFSEYRKQSATLYKFIYDYFLTVSKKPLFFFEKLFYLIEADNSKGKPHKHTQLVLFCLKSASQSMISVEDAQNIRKIISFVMKTGVNMPSRVAAELMNLIRDCTKEIREDEALYMECLKFSLAFIEDQTLCHYAACCFQVLMEGLGKTKEPEIVMNLIDFYHSKNFPKETIIQQILQGILSVIINLSDRSQVLMCLEKLLSQIYNRFRILSNKNQQRAYLVSLLEMKVVLNSYDYSEKQFKEYFLNIYQNVAFQALKMVQLALPYCLTNNLKVLTCNQLGLSCVIYKNALKICGSTINEKYLKIIQLSLSVLTEESIVEKYAFVSLLSETLITFSGTNVQSMNSWLMEKLPHINNYFISTFKNLELLDPDILKWFYGIQEGVILYSPQIFLASNAKDTIIDMGLYALRHVNEKNMQRKVINFIYLFSQQKSNQIIKWHPKTIEIVFTSIPIINSMWYHISCRIIINLMSYLQNKQEIIIKLLRISPYQDFPSQLVSIFTKMLVKVIEHRHERYLKNIFNDLSEYAKITVMPHMLRQLEIRYEFWRRELDKGS